MNAGDFGTFEVAVDPVVVAAFRGAVRLEADGAVPFTYPMRWLALPQVRKAAIALMSEPGLVPFHESQSFDYAQPLRIGAVYWLTVAARRESTPDRLVIRGTIASADGAGVAEVETVLRLFSTAQAA